MAFHGQGAFPHQRRPIQRQEQERPVDCQKFQAPSFFEIKPLSSCRHPNIHQHSKTHARSINIMEGKKDIKDCVLCGKACKKATRKDFSCGCDPYCTTCATAYLKSCISKPFRKPKCDGGCGSQKPFPDLWARQLLRRKEATTYFDLADEADEVSRNAALYCHDTACGRYIPLRYRFGLNNVAGTVSGTGTCPCGKLTCIGCGDKVHQGETCAEVEARWKAEGKLKEELERQSRRTMEQLTIKQCPVCGSPAEKADGGCNYVQCASCENTFDWDEASVIDHSKYVDGKPGDDKPEGIESRTEKSAYDNLESFEFNPFEDKPAENEFAESNAANGNSSEAMAIDEPAETM
ncbi:hypothetical protein CPAR01_03894 [Colletotrichum paranaense]|uniref:RING-type domain-containing protein n=1 Tax=Colletotrichum paranaense TaxID=1914294 RepID=A0ABQ9SWB7_9PEZI|nr:uncharacterized protein CPAR01_03894 [Colletotrichum paranaense]KAK1543261.1 hypothetical protein CPAR01_03894 [Colletotrichum paranaense]